MKKLFLVLVALLCSLHAEEIYANFNIVAGKSANLALTSGGIIDKVTVDIGSIVKKNDILAVLRNDDLKASLQISKANEANAKVSWSFAKKDYERQFKIKHLIDEERFDSYTLIFEKSKVALEYASATLDYAKAMLDKTILYAPFDGIIFEKSVEVGDAVSGVSPTTIFKIQSLHLRKLVLEYDQKYWKNVRIGDIYKYKIDGDDKEYEGVISKIYPYANENNRKIQAEIQTKDFIVGLFGSGTITSNEK